MGDDNRAAKVAAVMATLATAAATAALFKPTKVGAVPPGAEFPPEVLNLLTAIAQGMEVTIGQLDGIITAINNLSLNILVQGYPPNADSIDNYRKDLTIANLAVRLDELPIPDDMELVIKSWPFNPAGGLILVAGNKSAAENINSSYPLIPNEFRALRVKNANQQWVSATIVPAWVIVSAEKRA